MENVRISKQGRVVGRQATGEEICEYLGITDNGWAYKNKIIREYRELENKNYTEIVEFILKEDLDVYIKGMIKKIDMTENIIAFTMKENY